ncbi:MAG: hypothetical protein A3E01_10900 [Gammaproteobacteria bacterium RIFCSPHIGHO2_12_FULL_63_22]|nr:MAG: hypothetical protein A3E01_10900 [Gammaproteobacteria bacterium RIFCSPHIGHO2_12_FULL_63_22]
MRIVLDLGACQGHGNRVRGIGRYSRLLAQSMLRESRGHQFWIVLNGGMPEAIDEIRGDFDGLLPQERIVLWDNPFPAAELHQVDPWPCRVAEVLREDFLASLHPDVVHVASLFEGWNDPSAASIGRGSMRAVPTAVTLYDLIPLAMRDVYLKDGPTRRAYLRKLEDLRRADLCLAISEFTRRQAIELLDIDAGKVVNISGSVDPVFHRLPADPRRAGNLASRHGLWRPFVMYTGGFDHRKNVAGLIRAYAGLPGEIRASRQLLIVGKPPGDVHDELREVAREAGLSADEVCFAGYVSDTDLVGLYNACELYVFPSLMEGFGLPALEAMACGAPVIGADASSLPEVIGHPEAMFEAGSDEAMCERMLQGLVDPAFRSRLLDHAGERFRLFSWEATAHAALDALEALASLRPAAEGDGQGEDRWKILAWQAEKLSEIAAWNELPANAGRRLAAARSENLPGPRARQLLVDVSNLSQHDAGTGIQRVVRNVLRELYLADTRGFEVVPVRFDSAGQPRRARAFAARFAGGEPDGAEDPLLDARPGDIFLGLDLSAHIVPWYYESFDRMRRRGVAMHFVVYDLIPLLRPDCMDPGGVPTLQAWYQSIGRLADGLCCISLAVANELAEWCDQTRPDRHRPLKIGHFHLGSELDRAREESDAPEEPQLEALASGRCFLMVGTIEPRKGHSQVLDAFELLWRDGVDARLAIIGKPGWLMESFTARLEEHPEIGRRLHWFADIDDRGLRALYAGSAALLAASEAEGFGLPIVEAAGHGLPVIARDLPVFREVAGEHAFYFSGFDPRGLADALQDWLDLADRGLAPASRGMPRLDWKDSAAALIRCVIDGEHDICWRPSGRRLFPATDPRLLRQVGRLHRQQLLTDHRSGFLTYGPYASFAAGNYRLRVRGHWISGSGPAIWMDVVSEQGSHRLAHHELVPGHGASPAVLAEIELQLFMDVPDLEIRLWVSAETVLALDGFELEPRHDHGHERDE